VKMIKRVKEWWKLNRLICSPLGHIMLVISKYVLAIVLYPILMWGLYEWVVKGKVDRNKK